MIHNNIIIHITYIHIYKSFGLVLNELFTNKDHEAHRVNGKIKAVFKEKSPYFEEIIDSSVGEY